MSRFKLLKVETDINKIYRPSEKFTFKLTFNNEAVVNDDVEFVVTYFGDAYSDSHDQNICHNTIGPLQTGKLYFELETSPIDLTKIPIKTLFGLTTILIVGKFKGEQFIRIGYVVDVSYPGINNEDLIDSEEEAIDIPEEEEEAENEEELSDGEDDLVAEDEEESGYEVMDDEDLEDEEELKENEECSGDDQPCSEDDGCESAEEDGNLVNSIADALLPKTKERFIPLETPIVDDSDMFDYKNKTMDKRKIELKLLENPIIQVFDIEWGLNGKNEETENIQSSSENEDNVQTENETKKQKINE